MPRPRTKIPTYALDDLEYEERFVFTTSPQAIVGRRVPFVGAVMREWIFDRVVLAEGGTVPAPYNVRLREHMKEVHAQNALNRPLEALFEGVDFGNLSQ